ncbi:probable N-acetyltransferase CML1 [Rana temporaria]|uniref:probable N-acetyltransferase CML1 n=1 Tax=Rana temporaria TaxID=8407 RepID=UPI001AAD4D64|nr:probable N-acetyltransferase CML1 [Rana temporaria]
MSDYHIRLYKDSDHGTVRDIFVQGYSEPYPVSIRHTLRLPRVWILLLAVFLLALKTTGSSTVSSMVVISVILALLLKNRDVFFSYARTSLAGDMLDIRKHYLQRDGCCFWVAESEGEIVGMAAAAPFPHPGGQNRVELKRLSVPKEHRGRGIGKALCKTVIDFARTSGYQAVVLETTMFHVDSVRLYKRLGFRITHVIHPEEYFAKFIDFKDIFFLYDLSKQQ